MNKTIKYVGFYDDDSCLEEERTAALPAINYMNYICLALVKAGYNVDIISPSWTGNPKGKYSARKSDINDNIRLILGPTKWGKSKLKKAIGILVSWLWLLRYLLKNVEKNEPVIVYHSIFLMVSIYLARKFKKFNLILEVNEIYQHVIKRNFLIKNMEKITINSADQYIFTNDMFKKLLNTNKNSTVVYGTYERVPINPDVNRKNGQINIVYSGLIDDNKGSMITIYCAKFLPKNYHIHILGFGREDQLENCKRMIYESNLRNECKVSFHGVLKGDQYNDFLQGCDIGFCTQLTSTDYSDTSFPSKILSYMSNGLRVVSTPVAAIINSKIGHLIYFSKSDDPFDVVQAVLGIKMDECYDSRSELEKLEKEFIYQIKQMLSVN